MQVRVDPYSALWRCGWSSERLFKGHSIFCEECFDCALELELIAIGWRRKTEDELCSHGELGQLGFEELERRRPVGTDCVAGVAQGLGEGDAGFSRFRFGGGLMQGVAHLLPEAPAQDLGDDGGVRKPGLVGDEGRTDVFAKSTDGESGGGGRVDLFGPA